jgi:hypothetical protein
MQSISFFNRLPYDVRAIIYHYLEPETFPPFSPGFRQTTSGFVLSCREAKQDLEEIAAMHLAKYLSEFRVTVTSIPDFTLEISAGELPKSMDNLRHITITLPFSAFECFHPCSGTVCWKREVLEGLHPLFAKYFDKVRIHFRGQQNKPATQTLFDRGCVEVAMHHLLRDITYMIEHVNKGQAGETMAIFKYEAGQQNAAYPRAHVKAKRICLSWDFRPEPTGTISEQVILNGRMHSVRSSRLVTVGANSNRPLFYHLRNEQRIVGEMGIVSNSRWKLDNEPIMNTLLNGVSTRAEFCSSDGLGNEIRLGLRGVVAEEFEEQEQEMSKVLHAT